MRALTAFLNTLPTDVRDSLENELERAAREVGTNLVAQTMARLLVKSIDTAVAVGVKHLSPDQVAKFGEAFDDTVWEELEELGQAIAAYTPLQADVEIQKKQHGSKSEEANAARQRRTVGLSGFRSEVRDLVLAASGGEPTD